MEKIIYALWRDPSVPREKFNAQLLTKLAPALHPLCHGLRLNIQDPESSGGTAPVFFATSPPMEAALQIWLDSAVTAFRAEIDALIASYAPRFSAWLVSESTPIPRDFSNWKHGQRSQVYTHLAFISVPPRLSWAAWQDLWQTHHTPVAMETQSNNEYVQNLIVRPLTYGAPSYSAIIEESFPELAKKDEAVFHDAVDDPDRLQANMTRLRESTFRFVDADRFDLIPVGQYDFKRLASL